MSEDALTQFIAAVVPAVVIECSQRLQLAIPNGIAFDEFADTIASDLTNECNFDIEELSDSEATPAGADTTNTSADTTTHIQNLKIDLSRLYADFKKQIIEDATAEVMATIRDSLKTEMRMEMFMELEKMKARAPAQTQTQTPTQTQPQSEFGFNQFVSSQSKIEPILGGFESIKQTADFNLESNSLYKSVTQAITRAKEGKAAYTPDELIKRRGDRFDQESIQDFRSRAAAASYQVEPEDPEENDMWDKLMREKYGH